MKAAHIFVQSHSQAEPINCISSEDQEGLHPLWPLALQARVLVLGQCGVGPDSQVLATALDEYYQLTIMLMVLVIGMTLLAHLAPLQAKRTQSTQVMH